ncbi:hypothetical protein EDD86DRAFT_244703 [Gorgonomyces haynaldii]|nr:hypothetical protein EDD86DRAFT_244703 [Gorgonomyces haynaldii]
MVRIKNRYFLCELQVENDEILQLNKYALLNALSEAIQEWYGQTGLGEIIPGLQVKYFSPATGMLIIRVTRKHYQQVWAALGFMNQLRNRGCKFSVIHISGTIKKVQQKAIKYDKECIARLKDKIPDLESVIQSNQKQLQELDV